MSTPSPRLLPCLALVLACAGSALAQGNPAERFQGVKEWRGLLTINVSGAGSLDFDAVRWDYSVSRHLDYPFFLDGPGASMGGWWTCSTSQSAVSIEEVYTTTIKAHGCVNKLTRRASGPLEAPPHDPNIPLPLPQCVAHGFQLQIFPFPLGEDTYTSWGFQDSVVGEEIHEDSGPGNCASSSATYEAHLEELLGFSRAPICQGLDCLELPEAGYNIVQHWSYEERGVGGYNVPLQYEVRLELTGCGGEAEVAVEVLDYESWRPQGGQPEEEEGNQLVLEARLKGKGECSTELKARRFIFELVDVSAEPGVCMNWPPASGNVAAKPDLAFEPDFNVGQWKPVARHASRIVTTDGQYQESPRAYVSCYDWGAHASVRVTAEFDDHPPIVGYLESEPDVTSIPIPRRQKDSKIADVWKQEAQAQGLADTDDEEDDPVGDGHTGDGLSLYEEYRGFYEGSDRDHIHGHPRKKDLFVVDTAGLAAGIDLFRKLSGLEVHDKLKRDQVTSQRVVNFHRGPTVGQGNDQHALLIERAPLREHLAAQATGGPGLPRSIQRIVLNTTIRPRSVSALVGGSQITVTQEASITAHELAHGCNIYHHGEPGGPVNLQATDIEGVLVYARDGNPNLIVPLVEESCGAVEPILPASITDHRAPVYLAVKGGKQSGVESCILRYSFARYYLSQDRSRVLYHDEEEAPGFTLCNSRIGTGVNACSHCPEPRYGHATVGECKKQLCVNDRRSHTPGRPPEREPVPPCGRGGGGGEEEPAPPAIARGGAAGLTDPPPLVALTVNERRTVAAYRGWPLLVGLQIIPPGFGEEAAPEFVLASSSASWTDLVRLVLRRGGAETSLWPLERLGPPARQLTLSGADVGTAVWWVSPTASAAIPPGEYTLDAILDSTSAPAGWQGIALGEPVRITVAAEPSPLGVDRSEKVLALANFEVSRGGLDEALRHVEALLTRDPANLGGLLFRAEILELTGEDRAALAAYAETLAAFEAAHPDAPEPPVDLIASHAAVGERVRSEVTAGAVFFRRGDVNQDGEYTISDPVLMLGRLFRGAPTALPCEKSADADDSGVLDLTDAVHVLAFLFTGGQAPPPPFRACGVDPTADGLGCSDAGLCD